MLYVAPPKPPHIIQFTVHNGEAINNIIYTLNTITKVVTWFDDNGINNEDSRYTQKEIYSFFYTKTWIKI